MSKHRGIAYLPILLISIFLSSCVRDSGTSIQLSIGNLERDVIVELHEQEYLESKIVSSVTVKASKPTTRFTLRQLEEPTFFHIILRGANVPTITLLLDQGENTILSIDLHTPDKYNVENSEGSALTQILSDRMRRTNRSLDSLSRGMKVRTGPIQQQALTLEMEAVRDSQRAFSTRFIWDNPRSRASVMALYQKYSDDNYVFDRIEDHTLFRVVGSALQALYPHSEYTKGIIRDIKNQVKVINNHNLNQLVANAEPILPEIALPSPEGDTIRLSSLRGKVILLDFWASWNVESLMENRELLEIYRKYNPKGFEVYQVSLDYDRERWVNAIGASGLPWVNVSELNPESSKAATIYNVTSLPANYLIDKNYDIIGKNLFGSELEAKLKEILR